jgi:hypothetical protein
MAFTSIVLLAGCSPSSQPAVQPISTPQVSETPAQTSLPVESGMIGLPLSTTCTTLVTVDELYKFNPNFALDPSKSPTAGSLAKLATDYKGISCTYVNLSAGDTITVALAKLDNESSKRLVAQRSASSKPYSGAGVPSGFIGLFSESASGGTLELLGNGYWLAASAPWAKSPDDVLKLVGPAIAKTNM